MRFLVTYTSGRALWNDVLAFACRDKIAEGLGFKRGFFLMTAMDRREFLGRTAGLVTTALAGRVLGAEALASRPASSRLLKASDTITLGRTGIKPSRLAMGTGCQSGKEIRDLGVEGAVRLLRHGYDQGLRWWDAADMYGTHHQIKAALKEIKQRDRVVVTTKMVPTRTMEDKTSKTTAEMKADVERFRKEMDTDYIDILLLHCMDDGNWPQKMKGAMDVLSEAKQKGIVRAIGFSCHGLAPLKAGVDVPWVDVVLARFNPYAAVMDVDKAEQVPQVEQILQAMHERGKAVYAMKLIGAGGFSSEKIDATLRFVLSKRYISGINIGMSQPRQVDDIIQRIDRARVMA